MNVAGWGEAESLMDDVSRAILDRKQDSRVAGKEFIVVARYDTRVFFFPKNFISHTPHPATTETFAKHWTDALLAIGYGRYWRDQFLPRHAQVFIRIVPVSSLDRRRK